MKIRRMICVLVLALCIGGLVLQVHYLNTSIASLLVTGTFSAAQRLRFESILDADALITAYGSYARADWVVMEDEHQRRYEEASAVFVWKAYTPAYATQLLYGRFLLPSDRSKVVLHAKQASTLFCTYDCVGRTVLVDGVSYEVVGVYQPGGMAATLSLMGKPECFVSAAEPQENWVLTIASDKETQREFTLPQTLSRLGVQNVRITALFRARENLRFALRLQCVLLLCFFIKHLGKKLRPCMQRIPMPLERLASPVFSAFVVILLFYTLSTYPIDPSHLPTALSWEAICSKLDELRMLWNNRIVFPSMESSYLQWLSHAVCLLSACFWLTLMIFLRKGREHRA